MAASTQWRLAPEFTASTQGLIVSPFAHLPEAVAWLLDTSAAPGAGWLRAVLDPADGGLSITPATGKEIGVGCAAIAFTAAGLRTLGVPTAVMDGFATAFTEGMHAPNRRRRLSDASLQAPGREQLPLWGGDVRVDGEDRAACERTVHATILLYHAIAEQLAAFGRTARACLARHGVAIRHELRLSLRFDGATPPVSREHFGFADGLSQPIPHGPGIVTDEGHPTARHPVHGIASGDVLIGHRDAHDEPSPGPLLPAEAPGAAMLPPAPGDATRRSLGQNGSYLVMRELSQDADAFWASMAQAGRQVGQTADWVAERVIGRTRDGVVLAACAPGPTADGPGNDFLFFADDPEGRHCPLGAHIRRANPRDGLAPGAGDTTTLLNAANRHRILRRGRKYAAYAADGRATLPGLLFMCLNSDIERQFEFVQQTWMLNPSFAALIDERDPLLGPRGPFTLPADPLRRKVEIDTFVRLVGGEYFFLPSLPALAWFAALPDGAP